MASRSFEQSRLSVPAARDWVLGLVSDLPSDLIEITALLASELVTNAVLYGSGHFQVSVERFVDRRRVWIGVTDSGAGHPTPQNPDDTAEHGRGLQLVNALSAAWGVQRQRQTKTVWFELATRRSPNPAAARSPGAPLEPPEPPGAPPEPPGEPVGPLDVVQPTAPGVIAPTDPSTQPEDAGVTRPWGRFYARRVRRLWYRDMP